MILTEAGEVGVHVSEGDDGRTRTYLLRPSLYAMTQVGTPTEIVETYAIIMSPPSNARGAEIQLQTALSVLFACCEEDVTEIFGHWGVKPMGGVGYVPGAVVESDILPLAQCMMKHGVTGALKALPSSADADDTYVEEFDARAQVALAMAHLGVTEREAWGMTMTTLVGAMRAKFPPLEDAPGSRAPSSKELDATMDWLDRVEAARAAKKGSH